MRQPTLQHRAAAVRKSWSYSERVQRAVAAQSRCQRLLSQLGLTALGGEMMLACQPMSHGSNRRSG